MKSITFSSLHKIHGMGSLKESEPGNKRQIGFAYVDSDLGMGGMGEKNLPCLLVLLLPIASVLWGVFDTIVQSLVVCLFLSLSLPSVSMIYRTQRQWMTISGPLA